jgi:hypothetical protein
MNNKNTKQDIDQQLRASKARLAKKNLDRYDEENLKKKKRNKIFKNIFYTFIVILILFIISIVIYVKTHPLVFNESFIEHAHCMSQVGLALRMYSARNNDNFPYSEKGYADGLAKASEYCSWIVTGPGYKRVLSDDFGKEDVSEDLCGRVYIQGLKENDDCDIAILFDKLATPGGDHCHFIGRMIYSYGREVLFIDGHHEFIKNEQWDDFVENQIKLLVKAGIPKEKAEWYYKQIDKE